MIPCIENKCLKYPTCRNKTRIECTELEHYFLNEYAKLKGSKSYDHDAWPNTWLKIKEVIPNIRVVYRESLDKMGIIEIGLEL